MNDFIFFRHSQLSLWSCFIAAIFFLASDGISEEPNYQRLTFDSTTATIDHRSLDDLHEQGYAIVLPGVLGKQFWDRNVAAGLRQANFQGTVEIYDWTRKPILLGLSNLGGNPRQASVIASRIVKYENQYPGRPVYLLGHSAGCHMVVKSLEALPRGYQVDRAILLASCLASDYDLRPAMAHTRLGIVNFNSIVDVTLSQPLTSLVGVTHGQLNLASGVFGFKAPSGVVGAERDYYSQMLNQKSFKPEMIALGNLGGHFGATKPAFVAKQIAPILAPVVNPVYTPVAPPTRPFLEPVREAHRTANPVDDGSIHMNFSG